MHVAFAGGFLIAASPLPSPSPQISLQISNEIACSFSASCIPTHPPCKITAVALDQSQPSGSNHRLAVFYSTGTFCLFQVSPSNPKDSKEVLSYTTLLPRQRGGPIVQAVYHHPLLISLSSLFNLCIYEVPSFDAAGPLQVRLAQVLTSFTSYPPTSLVLSRPSAQLYKLILAYTVPVYPQHWTIGVTELIISSFSVQSTQSSTAFDLAPGWTSIPQEDLLVTLNDRQLLKLPIVSCTSTDGRYVAVASPASTSIQLYKLSSRSAGSKLSFVRYLYGHASPIQALSMSDGRCVSLSQDGSLWIWDLDREGVEVKTECLDDLTSSTKVFFDERRIIVVVRGRIVIKRFDV